MKLISIVIPVYNEHENVFYMYKGIKEIFKKINHDFEIIFVDDGSKDTSWENILKLSLEDKRVKGLNFSKNFGKEIALSAGLDHASGDAVISIDGDGQHPIEKIPSFVRERENGFDIVLNQRPKNKGANFIKKTCSFIFYKVFNAISGTKINHSTTDYRLLDKKVVDVFKLFKEKNRVFRILIDSTGFKTKVLIFDAKERIDNTPPRYSFWKLVRLAIHSVTAFSLTPLKLVGVLGGIISLGGSFMLFLVILDKLGIWVLNFTNLAIVVIINTILNGIVLISLGLMSLYIASIHDEVKGRPLYILREKTNL